MLLFEQHINDSTIWDVLKYRFLAHVMVNKKVYLPVNMTSETMYFLKSNNSSRYTSWYTRISIILLTQSKWRNHYRIINHNRLRDLTTHFPCALSVIIKTHILTGTLLIPSRMLSDPFAPVSDIFCEFCQFFFITARTRYELITLKHARLPFLGQPHL